MKNQKYSRRHFINKSGAIFVLPGLVVVEGCGGGSSENRLPVGSTAIDDPLWGKLSSVSGVVNIAEFGGGNVSVSTLQQQHVSGVQEAVASDGRFSVLVPSSNFQLIIVKDNNGNVRGGRIWIPDNSKKRATQALAIDSNTTSIALIFWTVGILTGDMHEIRSILSRIEQMDAFKLLYSHLKTNLPTQTLDAIVHSQVYQDTLIACQKEWSQLTRKRTRDIQFGTVGTSADIVLTLVNSGNFGKADPATIMFENYGWRYLQIFRRDLDGDTERSVTLVRDTKDGIQQDIIGTPTVSSWGELFRSAVNASSLGEASIWHDYPNFTSINQISKSEYWITGLGMAPNGDVLPSTIKPETLRLLWKTLSEFIILPGLGIVLTMFSSISKSDWIKLADKMWVFIESRSEIMDDIKKINSIIASNNSFNDKILIEIMDICRNILQLLISTEILHDVIYDFLKNKAQKLLLNSIQIVLNGIILGGDAVFMISNGYFALDAIYSLPSVLKIPIEISADRITVSVT